MAFESRYNYSFRAGHCKIILGLLRALRERRSFVDGGEFARNFGGKIAKLLGGGF